MSYLEKYRKEDFGRLSWEEYGKILETLFEKVHKHVKDNDIQIDAVVPILRGGAFPGTFLAFKFHLLRILPVQYKYFFEGRDLVLKKLSGLSKSDFKEKENPVFLLVENNHCFGLTAETAAKDLKAEFPHCRIIYAADVMDYSFQKNKYAEAIFYGKLNNETKKLGDEECKKLGIDSKSSLFPWEDIEEEWATVQGEQFKYADVEKVSAASESKEKINLDKL